MTGMIDIKKRNALIVKYAPLVKHIVERFVMRLPSHVNKEDLLSVGTIGLISAIERFDETRNVRFETFAGFRIRGAILDEMRAHDTFSRSSRNKDSRLEHACAVLGMELGRPPSDDEVARFMGLSLEEYYQLADDAQGVSLLSRDDLPPDYCERFASSDLLEKIEKENPFAAVAGKELRNILKDAIENLPEKEGLVLSLYYYEELTLKEIGAVLGLTESRISQIHSSAILKLRGILKIQGIKEAASA